MAEKKCNTCGEVKSLEEFHKHSVSQGGYRAMCKRCRKNVHYLHLYGIGIAEYEELFEEQNGRCKLCDQPEHILDHRTEKAHRLCVDHDHDTGEVRGLLCRRCNYVIGVLESVSPAWLKAAWQYLKGSGRHR